MCKKKFVLTVVAVIFFLGITTTAYSAERIAFVDLSRVVDEYSKTKSYEDDLSKKQDDFEKEHNVRLKKIQEAQEKLALLKKGEKEKAEEEIKADKQELMEYDQQMQTDLRRERDEKLREILIDIEKSVREFAEKEKYSMILNNKVLIYGSKDIDITEQVLKELNKKK